MDVCLTAHASVHDATDETPEPIEAIKALGYEDSAPPSTDAADDEVTEEAVS